MLQHSFQTKNKHNTASGRWSKSTFLNPDSLLYCLIYHTYAWPVVNHIHWLPEDDPQFPAFPVFLVILFLLPYFLSLSILTSWAYFALYQLKFHLSFKIYLKIHLFHEVFPSSHQSNHRYHTFTVSNVSSILHIILRSTPQDWIYSQFTYGDIVFI